MDRAEALQDGLRIEWACSPAPGAPLLRMGLQLSKGACVADALRAAGHGSLPEGWALAVWGRKTSLLAPLREGDRVELLRPLRADPMETRRRRQAHQAAMERPRKTRHRP